MSATPLVTASFAAALLGGALAPSAARPASDGVRLYLAGHHEAARVALADQSRADPHDTAALLFLGLVELRADRLDAAIAAWTRLLAADPDHPQAGDLRRHLTLLHQRAAARRATAPPPSAPADPRSVAVSAFSGSGSADAAVLARGVAAMVATDLARVPTLVVLDRIETEALRRELALAGLSSEGPRLGRLMRAARVTSGALSTSSAGEEATVRGDVAETTTGVRLGGLEVADDVDQLFALQKTLVFGLLEGLGVTREDLPAALAADLARYHTTSFEAFRHFSLAVEALDLEDFDRARAELVRAVDEDEDFELAAALLLAIPFGAFSTADIVAAVEGGARAGLDGGGGDAVVPVAAASAAPAVPESTVSVATTALAIGAVTLGVAGAGAAVVLLSDGGGSHGPPVAATTSPPPSTAAPVHVGVTLSNDRRQP